MKKLYYSFFSMLLVTLTLDAQIIDEKFDSYTLGPLGTQNLAVWSVWSGDASNTVEGITVSDAFAASGTQAGMISAGPGPQDAMLILSNLSEGVYDLSFNMYIPSGKTGYFNIQGMTSPSGGAGNGGNGVFNSTNLVFNNQASANGMPELGGAYPDIDDADPIFSWSYPEDAWFTVEILFEPEENRWTLTVDGTALPPQPFSVDMVVGAIDFFSIDANNEYYIDDILYQERVPNNVTNPVLLNAKVYPNPVVDVLRIDTAEPVDEITLYNVLGSPLINSIPNSNSSVVDMSQFAPGLYFAAIRIGNETSTIKVTK